jgi:hypothetical protein
MRKPAKTFINWISLEQQLLLKSALSDSDDAIDAWNEWKSIVDLDRIDYQSMRLLPMVYYNLQGRVSEDKFLNICKGNYRRTWLINKILFDSALPPLRAITEENIKILLIKGAGLILRYYNDFGLRPMGDLDFLVPAQDRKKAFKILSRLGWTSNLEGCSWKDFVKYRSKHSVDFEKGKRHIDLHWRSTRYSVEPASENDFWKDSVPYNFCGFPTRVLSPQDELLLIIVHGARRGNNFYCPQPRHPVHWIIDAMRVLSSSYAIDWQKFVMRTQKHIARLQIRDALIYLNRSCNAPIPLDVIQKISRNPTAIELFHYAHISGETEFLGYISQLRVWWGKYAFLYMSTYSKKKFNQLTRIQKLTRFLKFLQIIEFQIDHFWKLPFYLIRSILPGKRKRAIY